MASSGLVRCEICKEVFSHSEIMSHLFLDHKLTSLVKNWPDGTPVDEARDSIAATETDNP